MTPLQRTVIALTVIGAVGLAVYQTYKNNKLQSEFAALQAQVAAMQAAGRTQDSGTTPEVQRNADNEALTAALAKAQAEKDKLAAERDAAARMAELYKELADSREDTSITNKFPTQRHVTAAMGKLLRKGALMRQSLQGKKWEELTPEERELLTSGGVAMIGEYAQLAEAALKFRKETDEATPRDQIDDMTVLAYGALDLNEQQFQQVYSLLQRLHDEAASADLLGTSLSPEQQQALKDLNQRGLTEYQQLLTPEQQGILQSFGPNIPLVGWQPWQPFNAFRR